MSISLPVRYLMDWFIRYLKNRDIYFRKISDISEKDNLVLVYQKDGKTVINHVYFFIEDLEKELDSITEEHKGLVLYNTSENFRMLLNSWNRLTQMGDLTIYFINPFSKLEKKWIIKPFIHSRISETSVIKSGLKSMFETVDQISKAEIEELTS